MKAHELRIGNWVMDRGYKEWQIDHWETRNKVASNNTTTMCNGIMIETHPLTEYVDFLKPIPLTEEWLLKLGFEKKDNYGNYEYLLDGYSYFRGSFYISDCDECGESVEINFVHELQNLYFALTKKELTINLQN